MTTEVYVAIAGEYEVAFPLGVFDSLDKAKVCIEKSSPTYEAEVLVYILSSGERIKKYSYGQDYTEECGWSKTKSWKEEKE